MTRGPGVIDQSKSIGGSYSQSDVLDISNEPLKLGQPIAGQFGSSASISAILGSTVTMTGLTGMSSNSLSNFLTISGSNSQANNGTFKITAVFSPTTVNYENASAVVPDANNGSISWIERQPYSLQDDLNYARTNIKLIKGTLNWYDNIPIYVRPNNTLTDVEANISNIVGKTLDAHAWIDSRFLENVSVSTGLTFVTIVDAGNLKHADSVDITGIPISDGYDTGNEQALFVAITDADIDGYGDGSELRVLTGIRAGERIFGRPRAGSSTSPNSVEIEFYSAPIDDWSLSSATLYTWEVGQASSINIGYPYRERLDRFSESAIRKSLIQGSLSNTGSSGTGGGGGGGLSEDQHKALRHLIHFIDSGPGDGFASGAFHETLPAGSPFPTSYIWWTSSGKANKIVELIVSRGDGEKPLNEEWKMYDTDGSTVLATITDSINYSGPFEISRQRIIS